MRLLQVQWAPIPTMVRLGRREEEWWLRRAGASAKAEAPEEEWAVSEQQEEVVDSVASNSGAGAPVGAGAVVSAR